MFSEVYHIICKFHIKMLEKNTWAAVSGTRCLRLASPREATDGAKGQVLVSGVLLQKLIMVKSP